MRYHVLACDYDSTLAAHGQVDTATLDALRRARESGRKLVLVTGRELPDLLALLPEIELFDRVVAENGALLYHPTTREETVLGPEPPAPLVGALRAAGIAPLSVGRVIVATCEPHETAVLRCIRDLGLELQVIFNKGSVMVLPSGVNKASGLGAALGALGLSPHNCVAVGDGENDHALLALSECGVAVANAVPMLREAADLVTDGSAGVGVVELVNRLLVSDLRELAPVLHRHAVLVGTTADGTPVHLSPYGASVLIAGASGRGRSTLATSILEQLAERGYQLCVIDPEGDYSDLDLGIAVGDQRHPPTVEQVLDVLAGPDRHVVVNLLGLALEGRPAFFDALVPRIQELRSRTGRPHWLVVDEAHHLLPPAWTAHALTRPESIHGLLLITVHPEHVSPAILGNVDAVVAVGRSPERVFEGFCAATMDTSPAIPRASLEPGEALYWARGTATAATVLRGSPPHRERQRHRRKYAEGELGPDRSFYFRGPAARLNLRAHNLAIFVQMADGVDDDTWMHHLRAGDYSRWFRDAIKDEGLAADARAVETDRATSAGESRRRLREAIAQRYTLPA
ncbi:MAG: HAD hydrolase family protein [Candidatus Rokubacteria bacterium]|nr:HAD hydrolase family protein [Candidatus Rokubacteria bacterium]